MSSLKSLWKDAKIMGKGVRDAWKETTVAQEGQATVEGIKEHFREVKRINEEIAAQDAEARSFENVLMAKISKSEAQLSALSRTLDNHVKQEAAKVRAAEEKKEAAVKAREAVTNPVRLFFRSFWNDLKIIGRSLRDGWNQTNMGQSFNKSVVDPIRNHLREVREINETLAAEQEEVHGFASVTKRKIIAKKEEIGAMYVELAEYLELKAESEAAETAAAEAAADNDTAEKETVAQKQPEVPACHIGTDQPEP